MTISVDQLIENSFVISIDQKKYKAFAESFTNAGFDKIPRLIDGFKVNTDGNSKSEKYYKLPPLRYPILGNSFTHAAIVKYGKTFGKDFVCIFEDDAFPCVSAAEKVLPYLVDIPNSCGILKLGYDMIYGADQVEAIGSKYISGLNTYGSHAYVVFKKYYDTYMKFFEKQTICDASVFNDGPGILMIRENIFIQRTIAGDTKPINRLNNSAITLFNPEVIDIGNAKETIRHSKFVKAGNMIKNG